MRSLICAARRHSIPLQDRGGIVRASFLLVFAAKPLSATKACAALPHGPDDSWPLYGSRLNRGGSNSSRKSPKTGCESPAVPVNLRPICALKRRNSLLHEKGTGFGGVRQNITFTLPTPSQWDSYYRSLSPESRGFAADMQTPRQEHNILAIEI